MEDSTFARKRPILALITLCTSLVLGAGIPESAESGKIIFSEHFEKGLGSSWKEHVFQGHTQYQTVLDGTNHVLCARAESAASGMGTGLQTKVIPGTTLSWRWKIAQLPPGASDTDIKKFDHTVRLYVAFKAMVVPRTINYIWSANGKTGEKLNHPSSNRARMIILESGPEKTGQWTLEKRDLYKDWKTLFGDEPPEIQSIGLMTDSDGTRSNVTGYYDDIVLSQP